MESSTYLNNRQTLALALVILLFSLSPSICPILWATLCGQIDFQTFFQGRGELGIFFLEIHVKRDSLIFGKTSLYKKGKCLS